MKKLIPLLFLLLFCMIALAQENEQNDNQSITKQKSVYLELGGTALLYSVNYDKTFLRNNTPKFNLGLGASLFPLLGWSSGVTYIPLLTAQANLLTGKEKHFLETGVSFLYIVPAARIGYRYQASEGGFLFRAAFTPFYVPSGVGIGFSGFQPWGGVSLGYTF